MSSRSQQWVVPLSGKACGTSGTGRRRKHAAIAAALALTALSMREVAAQTPTRTTSTLSLDVNSIARRRLQDPPGTLYPYRNARRWWINYDECRSLNEEVIDFPLSVMQPGDPLEIWAGSGQDCSAVRGNEDRTQSCWIVAVVDRSEDPMTVTVPVRTIVARDVNTLTPPGDLGPDICNESTDNEGDAITFYFFLQDGGQAVTGSTTTWDPQNLGGTGFDMVGPEPPGQVSLGMGESQLRISVSNVDEEADRERFAAYCVPLPLEQTDCSTPLLVEGMRPPENAYCGSARETSGTIVVDDLDNGTTYAIAVTGEDAIGNDGPLSATSCGTPQELDDFFELYTREGGGGGGGFCDVSPGPARTAPAGAVLLGLVLAALRSRRSRERA